MKQLLYSELLHSMQSKRGLEESAKRLAATPVYEVTNILPIIYEKGDSRRGEIPIRPPHKDVWIEFVQSPVDGDAPSVIVGQWWRLANYTQSNYEHEAKIARDNGDSVTAKNLSGTLARYEVLHFFKATLWDDGKPTREIIQLDEVAEFYFHDEYRRAVRNHIPLSFAGLTTEQVSGQSKLSIDDLKKSFETDNPASLRGWYEPMGEYSFALMHCANIETEEIRPSAKTVRAALSTRSAQPRPYRVLKLSRLYRAKQHEIISDVESTIENEISDPTGKRFHICRGHFKHLRDVRFHKPGWYWWPEHWRGDKKAGIMPSLTKVTP